MVGPSDSLHDRDVRGHRRQVVSCSRPARRPDDGERKSGSGGWPQRRYRRAPAAPGAALAGSTGTASTRPWAPWPTVSVPCPPLQRLSLSPGAGPAGPLEPGPSGGLRNGPPRFRGRGLLFRGWWPILSAYCPSALRWLGQGPPARVGLCVVGGRSAVESARCPVGETPEGGQVRRPGRQRRPGEHENRASVSCAVVSRSRSVCLPTLRGANSACQSSGSTPAAVPTGTLSTRRCAAGIDGHGRHLALPCRDHCLAAMHLALAAA